MKGLFSRILVAISGSEASINAAKYSIILAKIYHCELTVVYVVDTATLKELLVSKIFVADESMEYQKSLEANGHRYLNYVEELAASKGVSLNKVLSQGAIYTEILRIADEIGADLIVLGGWEQNRDARDLISRSHREILLNAKCSVLVTKEQRVDLLFKKY